MGERGVERVAGGFVFTEGPRWHGDRLYFSDVHGHQVHALEPDGEVTALCEVPGKPSGLGFTPDGDLLISSMVDRRLLRLHDGELTEVADLGALASFHLNDMVVDEAGRAYVGNFGSNIDEEGIRPARLIRVDPDGGASVAAEDLVFPNGTVLSPDGRTLIIAESFALRITAFDVAADGSLSGRRTWARFGSPPGTELRAVLTSGKTIPDGICLDAENALWVGDPTGSGAKRVIEGGQVTDVVDTGDLAVYAVALGGADRRTLYMCASPPIGTPQTGDRRRGCLLACRVEVPGAGPS